MKRPYLKAKQRRKRWQERYDAAVNAIAKYLQSTDNTLKDLPYLVDYIQKVGNEDPTAKP
jgi:hypothetical protein